MKNVVLLRHGQYDTIEKRDVLTPVGIHQMKYLGDKIASLRHEQTVSIYTSTSERAIQSSKTINERLSGEVKTPAEFLYEGQLPWGGNNNRLQDSNFPLVKAAGYSLEFDFIPDADLSDIVVIVTHLGTYNYLAKAIINAMKPPNSRSMHTECKPTPDQGTARWFDLEKRETFII